MVRPPTPNLDAVIAEFGVWSHWAVNEHWWVIWATLCSVLLLVWAFVGGIRSFFRTEKKDAS